MTQNFNFSPAFSRQPEGDSRLHRPKAPTGGYRSSPRTDRTSPVIPPASPLGRPRTAQTRQSPVSLLVSPPVKSTQAKGEPNSPMGTNRHTQIHASPKLSFNTKNSATDTLRRLSPAGPEMLCINSSNNQSKESLTIDPAFISIAGIPSDMQTVNMSNGSVNNQRVSFNNLTGSADDIMLFKRPIPHVLPKPEECTLRVREGITTRRSQQTTVTAERSKSHVKKRTAEIKSCYDELDEWIAAAYEHHQVMLRSNGYT